MQIVIRGYSNIKISTYIEIRVFYECREIFKIESKPIFNKYFKFIRY